MYEQFYNFTEKPFNLTPDSKYFFPSKEHEEALNSLIYTVNERKGFAVITGEIGAGKTIICRTLLNKLDTNTKTAIITNTYLTGKQLIQLALEDFGIQTKAKNKVKLMKELNDFLIRQLSLGCNVVLIIDEAQNLRPSVLEEVRMLSNLETEKEKLIQILLLGQPELRDQLNLQELAQLKQRINICYHIYPLTEEETAGYINHRLKVAAQPEESASQPSEPLLPSVHFTDSALRAIYAHSQGIPRLINMICDHCLLAGYVQGAHEITDTLVKDALTEFAGKR